MNTKYGPVVFRKCDIAAGLMATKCGKACGVDGLAAEQFLYADYLILLILFNAITKNSLLQIMFIILRL